MHCLEIFLAVVVLIAVINGGDTKFLRPYRVRNACRNRNICQNGGTCISYAKHWMYWKCKCPDGYFGRLCQRRKPQTEECVIDHCASSPCKHEGICTSGSTTFSCQCAHGYKGKMCEDIDHCACSPCTNNGTCTSGPTTFSCQCAHGFIGDTCRDTDHCASSPCKHNGTCTSGPTTFSCQCADGFIGETCGDIDHCASSPCKHNGTCTSGPTTFSCQCADGFIGDTCGDINHCASSPCKHNGTCTSGLTTFSCQCADGFIGDTCGDIDHCASSPCKHNGTCTSGPTTFSCQCADGFIGDTCGGTDHCASSPCKHNGTCTSGPTTFSCQCVDGFIGNTCGVKRCIEILQSDANTKGKDGVYPIYMDGEEKMVYCDMTTEGGGWTIIQKRIDGSTSFYRTWDNYKTGFGEPSKNYWIGNDAIHNLTKANNQEFRVDITMNSGEKVYAKYSIFRVGDETSKYRIIINGFSGTAGDGFVGLDGRKFSTHDNDNDSSGRTNCASLYGSAWWYAGCGFSDLNGNYWMSNSKYFMFWRIRRSMKETIMMIRTKK